MKSSLLGFPDGAPGVALLLMRLSVSGVLAFISLGCDSVSASVSIASAVLACLIAGGFHTRIAASSFAVAGFASIALGKVSLTCAPLPLEGVVITLLGPGAWSIDALNQRRSFLTVRDRRRRDR